jgi:hypothetical protein
VYPVISVVNIFRHGGHKEHKGLIEKKEISVYPEISVVNIFIHGGHKEHRGLIEKTKSLCAL